MMGNIWKNRCSIIMKTSCEGKGELIAVIDPRIAATAATTDD